MTIRNHTLKLAMAACLSMGSFAVAQNQPAPQPQPDAQDTGRDAADRASGRSPATEKPVADNPGSAIGNARDRLQGAGNMANAAQADLAIQQQLAAIARDPATASDKLFVLDAAMGNQWEIEFAKVVNEKAQDAKVKQAAQQIITDHTQAQQKLQEVAKAMNVTLPSELPAMKQQKLQIFRAMPVDKLETCFVVDSKAAHAKDVTSYSDHAKTVQDEQLRGYITAVLPKLQAHAQHIQATAQAKGLPGDMTTASGAMGSGGTGQPHQGHGGQMPTGRTE